MSYYGQKIIKSISSEQAYQSEKRLGSRVHGAVCGDFNVAST